MFKRSMKKLRSKIGLFGSGNQIGKEGVVFKE